MRFFKSSFVLIVLAIFFASLSAAQSHSPTQPKQPAAQSQPANPGSAKPPAQNSAPEFKLFPVPQYQYTGPRRTIDQNSAQPQQIVPDRGIYLKHPDGANMCASIMSYNFSPGDNPQLESITTCTPVNTQATRRTQEPRPAPQGPRVLQSVLSDQK